MQTKTEIKKDSNFKIKYSGIKFLYIKSPASLKPLSEQRLRKRKLFFPTHRNLYQLVIQSVTPPFKSNIFFYISTDIISRRGRGGGGRRKNRKKTPWNQHGLVFFF